MEETKKLYSHRAIGIATYLGGPLAAGILIRKNCLNLDREKQGINSLIIGIITTLLLFVIFFQIPEHIMDMIPSPFLPLIYSGIVYLIVEKIQGQDLKTHKENDGEFYSNWKATGIGFLSSIILLGGIFGYAYTLPDDWDVDSYDYSLAKFTENEAEALRLFEMIDYNTKQEIILFIDNKGVPKWKENIQLINSMSMIPDIPEEFKKQNDLLLEYSKLRVEAYGLIRKAVLNESSEYDTQIIALHTRIDKIIEEL